MVASYAKVGKAVDRNRAKRRLRALARGEVFSKAKPDCDYVLVATPQTNGLDFTKLRQDMQAALRRLKLLHDDGKNETLS